MVTPLFYDDVFARLEAETSFVRFVCSAYILGDRLSSIMYSHFFARTCKSESARYRQLAPPKVRKPLPLYECAGRFRQSPMSRFGEFV